MSIPKTREQFSRRSTGHKVKSAFDSLLARQAELLQEEAFQQMLTLERRRAERSGKPFVLMLVDASTFVQTELTAHFTSQVASVLLSCTRETDLVGWHKKGTTLGVIFTEVSIELEAPITDVLISKVQQALGSELSDDLNSKLIVSAHLFPDIGNIGTAEPFAYHKFYPDLTKGGSPKKRLTRLLKRVIDFSVSASLLILFSPLLAAIAVAIKLSSKGAVIFQQERFGQFGARFKCLKFRSMYSNNDPKIHQEYVQRFIAGQSESEKVAPGETVIYKITQDVRVTPVGRLLRKTSLDELPQLWNVLKGEMSLVGPRPPVPYEFEVYEIWHRRRVLELKPGLTGLWQVSGRSQICFDDMVRLDLRYSQSWSLWLDLRILLATPRAVINGEGAY